MKSPLLLDIPNEFQSKRLLMRCCLPGDGTHVHEAESETYDQLKQWFGPWAKEPCTKDQTEERVRQSQFKFIDRSELVFNCYMKEDGKLAARAWFSRIEWALPKAMFGMWVRSSLQRKGLGFEPALAFTLFGLEQVGFQRIELYIDPRNDASLKLFEKVGYAREGKIRNYSFDNHGVMRDYFIYSVIPADKDKLDGR